MVSSPIIEKWQHFLEPYKMLDDHNLDSITLFLENSHQALDNATFNKTLFDIKDFLDKLFLISSLNNEFRIMTIENIFQVVPDLIYKEKNGKKTQSNRYIKVKEYIFKDFIKNITFKNNKFIILYTLKKNNTINILGEVVKHD